MLTLKNEQILFIRTERTGKMVIIAAIQKGIVCQVYRLRLKPPLWRAGGKRGGCVCRARKPERLRKGHTDDVKTSATSTRISHTVAWFEFTHKQKNKKTQTRNENLLTVQNPKQSKALWNNPVQIRFPGQSRLKKWNNPLMDEDDDDDDEGDWNQTRSKAFKKHKLKQKL